MGHRDTAFMAPVGRKADQGLGRESYVCSLLTRAL